MKRKKSLVILIAFTFFGLYGLYTITEYLENSNMKYEIVLKQREESLRLYTNLSINYLQNGLFEDLEDRLEQARYQKSIDFYILKYRDLVVYFGNKEDDSHSINRRYKLFNKIVYLPNMIYSTVKEGEYSLTIGFHKYRSRALFHLAQREFPIVVRDIFIVGLLVLAVSFYFLKDFHKILFRMKGVQERDFSQMKSTSYELDLFIKGLSGYEKNVTDLKKKTQALQDQVLPALQSELMSGQKPPYDFTCTMVLTDINSYSYIYDNFDQTKFIGIIKEFFFEAAHIISKYGGLIYKFVGDEALIYFKDEHHRNSAAVALSAAEELNALAASITARYEKEVGYYFTIKSAIAHGPVTLDSMIDTFELFGTNIIEASRIQSLVHEKTKNSVFYGQSIHDKVDFLFNDKHVLKTKLKGIKGERDIYSYEGRMGVKDILQNLTDDNVDYLYYYRSDEDIVDILNFLKTVDKTKNEDLHIKVTNLIKRITITKTSDTVRKAYKDLLTTLAKAYEESKDEHYLYYISSVIMNSINLISKSTFDVDISKLLKRFLNYEDKRVVANTLDAFVYFDATNEDFLFETLLQHQNNRILANVLIKEGMRSLDSKVISEIEKMVKDENPYFIASGLFAIGELSKYHKANNLVHYNTNIKFLNLVSDIKRFVESDNEMVRRQALLAAKKINDETLNGVILKIFNRSSISVIRDDISKYFVEDSLASKVA